MSVCELVKILSLSAQWLMEANPDKDRFCCKNRRRNNITRRRGKSVQWCTKEQLEWLFLIIWKCHKEEK